MSWATFALVAASFLAWQLFASARWKLRHPVQFYAAVSSWHLFSTGAAWRFTRAFPIAELAVAGWSFTFVAYDLMTLLGRVSPVTTAVGLGPLVLFFGSLVVGQCLIRFRTSDARCGCTAAHHTVGWFSMARAMMFLCASMAPLAVAVRP